MFDAFVAFLIIAGASFALIGSIGLVRFADFYTRLHGPTKATTLGVGSVLIASAVFFSARGDGISLHEILVSIFLFMTAPVSAHIMSKAALHSRVRHESRAAASSRRAAGAGDPASRRR
jgi:multicomponent K+:H+ antiporter subunit G